MERERGREENILINPIVAKLVYFLSFKLKNYFILLANFKITNDLRHLGSLLNYVINFIAYRSLVFYLHSILSFTYTIFSFINLLVNF